MVKLLIVMENLKKLILKILKCDNLKSKTTIIMKMRSRMNIYQGVIYAFIKGE